MRPLCLVELFFFLVFSALLWVPCRSQSYGLAVPSTIYTGETFSLDVTGTADTTGAALTLVGTNDVCGTAEPSEVTNPGTATAGASLITFSSLKISKTGSYKVCFDPPDAESAVLTVVGTITLSGPTPDQDLTVHVRKDDTLTTSGTNMGDLSGNTNRIVITETSNSCGTSSTQSFSTTTTTDGTYNAPTLEISWTVNVPTVGTYRVCFCRTCTSATTDWTLYAVDMGTVTVVGLTSGQDMYRPFAPEANAASELTFTGLGLDRTGLQSALKLVDTSEACTGAESARLTSNDASPTIGSGGTSISFSLYRVGDFGNFRVCWVFETSSTSAATDFDDIGTLIVHPYLFFSIGPFSAAPSGFTASRLNSENVLVAIVGHSIEKATYDTGTSATSLSTLAGSAGTSGTPSAVGSEDYGTSARFNNPSSLVYDWNEENIYIADKDNHCIRELRLEDNRVRAVAGQCGTAGTTDGTGTAATITSPVALALHPGGKALYWVDETNAKLVYLDLSDYSVTTTSVTSVKRFAINLAGSELAVLQTDGALNKRTMSDGYFSVAASFGTASDDVAAGAGSWNGKTVAGLVYESSTKLFIATSDGNVWERDGATESHRLDSTDTNSRYYGDTAASALTAIVEIKSSGARNNLMILDSSAMHVRFMRTRKTGPDLGAAQSVVFGSQSTSFDTSGAHFNDTSGQNEFILVSLSEDGDCGFASQTNRTVGTWPVTTPSVDYSTSFDSVFQIKAVWLVSGGVFGLCYCPSSCSADGDYFRTAAVFRVQGPYRYFSQTEALGDPFDLMIPGTEMSDTMQITTVRMKDNCTLNGTVSLDIATVPTGNQLVTNNTHLRMKSFKYTQVPGDYRICFANQGSSDFYDIGIVKVYGPATNISIALHTSEEAITRTWAAFRFRLFGYGLSTDNSVFVVDSAAGCTGSPILSGETAQALDFARPASQGTAFVSLDPSSQLTGKETYEVVDLSIPPPAISLSSTSNTSSVVISAQSQTTGGKLDWTTSLALNGDDWLNPFLDTSILIQEETTWPNGTTEYYQFVRAGTNKVICWLKEHYAYNDTKLLSAVQVGTISIEGPLSSANETAYYYIPFNLTVFGYNFLTEANVILVKVADENVTINDDGSYGLTYDCSFEYSWPVRFAPGFTLPPDAETVTDSSLGRTDTNEFLRLQISMFSVPGAYAVCYCPRSCSSNEYNSTRPFVPNATHPDFFWGYNLDTPIRYWNGTVPSVFRRRLVNGGHVWGPPDQSGVWGEEGDEEEMRAYRRRLAAPAGYFPDLVPLGFVSVPGPFTYLQKYAVAGYQQEIFLEGTALLQTVEYKFVRPPNEIYDLERSPPSGQLPRVPWHVLPTLAPDDTVCLYDAEDSTILTVEPTYATYPISGASDAGRQSIILHPKGIGGGEAFYMCFKYAGDTTTSPSNGAAYTNNWLAFGTFHVFGPFLTQMLVFDTGLILQAGLTLRLCWAESFNGTDTENPGPGTTFMEQYGLGTLYEECDDGNLVGGDGCSSDCRVETGWEATLWEDLHPLCGDGVLTAGETCDDGNRNDYDGCSHECQVEQEYQCTSLPSVCTTLCGDGMKNATTEGCDDGNRRSLDGCSSSCTVEGGWSCSEIGDGDPSICGPLCGSDLTTYISSLASGSSYTCDASMAQSLPFELPAVVTDASLQGTTAEKENLCNYLFDSSTLSLLGAGGTSGGSPECTFERPELLRVTLGTSATLTFGNDVTILANVLTVGGTSEIDQFHNPELIASRENITRRQLHRQPQPEFSSSLLSSMSDFTSQTASMTASSDPDSLVEFLGKGKEAGQRELKEIGPQSGSGSGRGLLRDALTSDQLSSLSAYLPTDQASIALKASPPERSLIEAKMEAHLVAPAFFSTCVEVAMHAEILKDDDLGWKVVSELPWARNSWFLGLQTQYNLFPVQANVFFVTVAIPLIRPLSSNEKEDVEPSLGVVLEAGLLGSGGSEAGVLPEGCQRSSSEFVIYKWRQIPETTPSYRHTLNIDALRALTSSQSTLQIPSNVLRPGYNYTFESLVLIKHDLDTAFYPAGRYVASIVFTVATADRLPPVPVLPYKTSSYSPTTSGGTAPATTTPQPSTTEMATPAGANSSQPDSPWAATRVRTPVYPFPAQVTPQIVYDCVSLDGVPLENLADFYPGQTNFTLPVITLAPGDDMPPEGVSAYTYFSGSGDCSALPSSVEVAGFLLEYRNSSLQVGRWAVTAASDCVSATTDPLGTALLNGVTRTTCSGTIPDYDMVLAAGRRLAYAVAFSNEFEANRAPSGGILDVNPRSGVAITTRFALSTFGWTDDSGGPLQYFFALWERDVGELNSALDSSSAPLQPTDARLTPLTAFTAASAVRAYLPEGSSQALVFVMDSLGATSVSAPVGVTTSTQSLSLTDIQVQSLQNVMLDSLLYAVDRIEPDETAMALLINGLESMPVGSAKTLLGVLESLMKESLFDYVNRRRLLRELKAAVEQKDDDRARGLARILQSTSTTTSDFGDPRPFSNSVFASIESLVSTARLGMQQDAQEAGSRSFTGELFSVSLASYNSFSYGQAREGAKQSGGRPVGPGSVRLPSSLETAIDAAGGSSVKSNREAEGFVLSNIDILFDPYLTSFKYYNFTAQNVSTILLTPATENRTAFLSTLVDASRLARLSDESIFDEAEISNLDTSDTFSFTLCPRANDIYREEILNSNRKIESPLLTCRYRESSGSWSTSGCNVSDATVSSGNSSLDSACVTCECTHLSSFGAFVEETIKEDSYGFFTLCFLVFFCFFFVVWGVICDYLVSHIITWRARLVKLRLFAELPDFTLKPAANNQVGRLVLLATSLIYPELCVNDWEEDPTLFLHYNRDEELRQQGVMEKLGLLKMRTRQQTWMAKKEKNGRKDGDDNDSSFSDSNDLEGGSVGFKFSASQAPPVMKTREEEFVRTRDDLKMVLDDDEEDSEGSEESQGGDGDRVSQRDKAGVETAGPTSVVLPGLQVPKERSFRPATNADMHAQRINLVSAGADTVEENINWHRGRGSGSSVSLQLSNIEEDIEEQPENASAVQLNWAVRTQNFSTVPDPIPADENIRRESVLSVGLSQIEEEIEEQSTNAPPPPANDCSVSKMHSALAPLAALQQDQQQQSEAQSALSLSPLPPGFRCLERNSCESLKERDERREEEEQPVWMEPAGSAGIPSSIKKGARKTAPAPQQHVSSIDEKGRPKRDAETIVREAMETGRASCAMWGDEETLDFTRKVNPLEDLFYRSYTKEGAFVLNLKALEAQSDDGTESGSEAGGKSHERRPKIATIGKTGVGTRNGVDPPEVAGSSAAQRSPTMRKQMARKQRETGAEPVELSTDDLPMFITIRTISSVVKKWKWYAVLYRMFGRVHPFFSIGNPRPHIAATEIGKRFERPEKEAEGGVEVAGLDEKVEFLDEMMVPIPAPAERERGYMANAATGRAAGEDESDRLLSAKYDHGRPEMFGGFSYKMTAAEAAAQQTHMDRLRRGLPKGLEEDHVPDDTGTLERTKFALLEDLQDGTDLEGTDAAEDEDNGEESELGDEEATFDGGDRGKKTRYSPL
uniref:PKD/REJ-like domain-containing protein n=1 Tax=Chromera velia CCMP2878 TaxID=1169474 RepID=A0A0G4FIM4_9ALVE|eukprot:Cvel_3369.t1-p1 / transcript=Cvel_3369.t1 / gene=Cvel_3369 / organism=Chromera_velia_CCMP2878 / gene_product=hypothetical protein / transcript_product=hypothetical protein / location=Cvel_scaffold135:12533-53240(-) / protein_length=3545 / sequence_SO=supercontig / SO=protein_coding / is_pseudo=false